LNKCKKCANIDTGKYRLENLEYYREYARAHTMSDKSKELEKVRAAKDKGKFPNKHRAHIKVTTALSAGRLTKRPCEVCGDDKYVHAHHDDYAEQLNVRWLCPIHHKKWHKENGAGLNAR